MFNIKAKAEKEKEEKQKPEELTTVANEASTVLKEEENLNTISEEEGEPTGNINVHEEQGKVGDEGLGELESKKALKREDMEMPAGVDSLISFINETGGTIQDYVRLNTDVESLDSDTLMKEYYKKTKPHLSGEDIDFYIEDKFAIDEDLDDERTNKLKGIAYKEELARAKEYLNQTKEKYYNEIKSKQARVDPKAQEALDFFNRYKQDESDLATRTAKIKEDSFNFLQKNESFVFDLGEKKFNYNIKDIDKIVKESDIKGFVQKFVSKEGNIDIANYHKSMYVANNAEKMMKTFYEQGKADMAKEITSQGKNISKSNSVPKNSEFVNGLKFKVISGDSGSKFRINKK